MCEYVTLAQGMEWNFGKENSLQNLAVNPLLQMQVKECACVCDSHTRKEMESGRGNSLQNLTINPLSQI